MSDPHDPSGEPTAPAFERVRKAAKQLLRSARAHDAGALARLRAALPRLASLDDVAAAEQLKLADVQHALAREAGLEHWAALKRQVEAAEPLIAQVTRFLGALAGPEDETMRDVLERFPEVARGSLHAACAACDLPAAEAWLARDPAHATARIGPNGGWTPLDCLAQSPLFALDAARGAASVAIGERLLALGADANTSTLQPGSHDTTLSVLYRASERGNAGLVRVLLAAGADPNDGEAAYHAAERDHRDVLELLLAHGLDISATHPRWDNTVLYYLSGYRDEQPLAEKANAGMRWLLEHGADPNVPSYKTRETPLHRVAASGRMTVVRILLEHGADGTQPRADGRTAYELAARNGQTAVAKLLAERGAAAPLRPVDAFFGACAQGDEAAARAVLDANPGLLDTLEPAERHMLGHAAAAGRVESVRTLAAFGFALTAESENGGTPLHWAAWHGQAGAVRELLERGAPVNVRDCTYGSSPLAWAAHGSHYCRSADDDYTEVVDLLLAAGVDRALTYNKWNEPPEALASEAVAEHLRARGFAPAEN
ncbi:MAG: ankyrin repeat domain-containing protein [Candidatus Eisenbacteria bacterium]